MPWTLPLLAVLVAPPLKGRPADFCDLIGQVRAAAVAGPTSLTTADAVRLTVTVIGATAGVLDPAPLSRTLAERFVLLGPATVAATPDRIDATWSLRPRDASVDRVPPLRLSHWNPATGRYEIARTRPIGLSVTAPPPRPLGTLPDPPPTAADRPAASDAPAWWPLLVPVALLAWRLARRRSPPEAPSAAPVAAAPDPAPVRFLAAAVPSDLAESERDRLHRELADRLPTLPPPLAAQAAGLLGRLQQARFGVPDPDDVERLRSSARTLLDRPPEP